MQVKMSNACLLEAVACGRHMNLPHLPVPEIEADGRLDAQCRVVLECGRLVI